MARIRTIKPEFWTDEKIVECSPSARLLFVGLWTFSDDRGVHQASVKRLKMEVFPGDDVSVADVEKMIGELRSVGLIREFQHEGNSYWHVVHFRTHQKIEKPTFKYPEPPKVDDQSASYRQLVGEESPTSRRPVGDSSATEGRGEESKGKKTNGNGGEDIAAVAAPPLSAPADVVGETELRAPANYIAEQWCFAFGGSVRVTEKRRKVIRDRWKDQWWRENWLAALEHAMQCPFLTGSNDRGWKMDFDFFLRPDTATKILEGKYDDQPRRKQTTAEAREALNASGFDWIRQAAAADAAAASGSDEGGGYLASPGTSLF